MKSKREIFLHGGRMGCTPDTLIRKPHLGMELKVYYYKTMNK